MNPGRRKLWLLVLGLISALVIAFLLRDVVEKVVVRPAVFLAWLLGVLYSFTPQPVLWLVLVLIMIYLVLGELAKQLDPPGPPPVKVKLAQGQVAELAGQIERKDDGIYFKWQIARTLGLIAMDMQDLRLQIRSRKLVFFKEGDSQEVRKYLDAGLNTSFSDYPMPWVTPISPFFRSKANSKKHPRIPIDGDIERVIEYLEAEMENNNDFRRA